MGDTTHRRHFAECSTRRPSDKKLRCATQKGIVCSIYMFPSDKKLGICRGISSMLRYVDGTLEMSNYHSAMTLLEQKKLNNFLYLE